MKLIKIVALTALTIPLSACVVHTDVGAPVVVSPSYYRPHVHPHYSRPVVPAYRYYNHRPHRYHHNYYR